jgi:hypothetical protein
MGTVPSRSVVGYWYVTTDRTHNLTLWFRLLFRRVDDPVGISMSPGSGQSGSLHVTRSRWVDLCPLARLSGISATPNPILPARQIPLDEERRR